MKKLVSLVMALIMVMGIVNVSAAEEAVIPDKVEISFKVGDSTLMINGNAVTVETPYVVGAGTTLVPLRVITEAFGARVTWVNETKEIILEYPDVNITLQIGNINATVNDHTEVLPEAPVLSPNGVTMVPLRFISETFGATVGYDNATAAITVVKENTNTDETITQTTDLPKIGDSYWNWSMMRPASMMMTQRHLDGSNTVFDGDSDERLYVYIYDVSDYEGSAYDDNYNEIKTYLSGYTLSKSEKSADTFGNKCFRIIARDKEVYMDFYSVYTDKLCYEVGFVCEAGSESITSLTAILESFKVEFAADDAEKAQTHDLSNVGEDGYRVVEDEELGVSFKIPATCKDLNYDQLNLIAFGSGKDSDPTEITVGLYSKDDNVTSKSLAQADSQHHKKYYNAEFCEVSDVFAYTATPCGENAYYYWVMTDGLYGGDYEMYDVFFEKGDYVYNVTVTVPQNKKETYRLVMESLVTKELDSEKIGVFLRNEIEQTSKKSSCSNWSVEVTSWWEEYVEPESAGAIWSNIRTGAALQLNVLDAEDIRQSEMKKIVTNLATELKGDGKLVEKVSEIEIGTKTYYTFQIYEESEELNCGMYKTVYVILIKDDVYMFTLAEDQEKANSQTEEDVKAIIESLEIK